MDTKNLLFFLELTSIFSNILIENALEKIKHLNCNLVMKKENKKKLSLLC